MWRSDSHQEVPLGEWFLTWTAPGAVRPLTEQPSAGAPWIPATVPGTVAGALRAAGKSEAYGVPARLDAVDWWYRCRLRVPALLPGERLVLCFEGLATLTDAWLDDEAILHSEGMFVGHTIDVTDKLRAEGELWLRFGALDSQLAVRRPRPRWRAPMVEHQQLRWFRTTLLGRTPGWSPPFPAVGPWRPVRLQRRTGIDVDEKALQAVLDGDDGHLSVSLTLRALGRSVRAARLIAFNPEGKPVAETELGCAPASPTGEAVTASGGVRIPRAARWWPHTHGAQPLYTARVRV